MGGKQQSDARSSSWFQRGFWRVGAVLSVISPALLLSGCATQKEYMGIAFTPGTNSSEVQNLARRAQRGDKQAQLELGIRYEEANGLPQDVKRARKLYRMAATPSGGTIYVYVPATTTSGKGYVTPVNMGPQMEGLEEAKMRLMNVSNSKSLLERNGR